MILIAYRHGLRPSELVGVRWDMLDLQQGTFHVERRKNGRPSVHILRGSEIRVLRRLALQVSELPSPCRTSGLECGTLRMDPKNVVNMLADLEREMAEAEAAIGRLETALTQARAQRRARVAGTLVAKLIAARSHRTELEMKRKDLLTQLF